MLSFKHFPGIIFIVLKSEVEDFRIQSEYTYKQLQDIKLKEKEMREEKEHELGLLETKVSKSALWQYFNKTFFNIFLCICSKVHPLKYS